METLKDLREPDLEEMQSLEERLTSTKLTREEKIEMLNRLSIERSRLVPKKSDEELIKAVFDKRLEVFKRLAK